MSFPLILAFFSESCLQQLLWCFNGDFLFPSSLLPFIIFDSSIGKICFFLVYVFNHLFTSVGSHRYFTIEVIIEYCHYFVAQTVLTLASEKFFVPVSF